jgi:hypothetical protein
MRIRLENNQTDDVYNEYTMEVLKIITLTLKMGLWKSEFK